MQSKNPARSNDESAARQKGLKTARKPGSNRVADAVPEALIHRARSPREMRPGEVLQLQRAVGNRAVGGLITRTAPGASRALIQRVSEAEVSQEVKSDDSFARQYPAWLKKTQAMTGMSTAEIVAAFSMDKLKDSVSRYAIHSDNAEKMRAAIWGDASWYEKILPTQSELAVAKVTEHYSEYLVQGLTASTTLKNYAGDKLGKNQEELTAHIKSALKVLDAAAFEKIYLESVKSRGLNVQSDYLSVVDAAKGFRAGDAFYLRLGSGTSADSLHSPIHEFMHYLSDPVIKNILGPDLNEGLTEIITQVVMGEAERKTRNAIFQLPSPAYGSERADVQQLMAEKSISQADLIKTYFHALQAPAGLLDKIANYRKGPPESGEALSTPPAVPASASSSSADSGHGALKP